MYASGIDGQGKLARLVNFPPGITLRSTHWVSRSVAKAFPLFTLCLSLFFPGSSHQPQGGDTPKLLVTPPTASSTSPLLPRAAHISRFDTCPSPGLSRREQVVSASPTVGQLSLTEDYRSRSDSCPIPGRVVSDRAVGLSPSLHGIHASSSFINESGSPSPALGLHPRPASVSPGMTSSRTVNSDITSLLPDNIPPPRSPSASPIIGRSKDSHSPSPVAARHDRPVSATPAVAQLQTSSEYRVRSGSCPTPRSNMPPPENTTTRASMPLHQTHLSAGYISDSRPSPAVSLQQRRRISPSGVQPSSSLTGLAGYHSDAGPGLQHKRRVSPPLAQPPISSAGYGSDASPIPSVHQRRHVSPPIAQLHISGGYDSDSAASSAFMQRRKHTSPPITQCHISTGHEADCDSEIDREDQSRTRDSALPGRRKSSHRRGRSGGGLREEIFKNNLTIANQNNLTSSTPAGLDNLPPNGSLPRSAVRQLPRHLVADDGFHSDSGIGSSVTVNGGRSDGHRAQNKVWHRGAHAPRSPPVSSLAYDPNTDRDDDHSGSSGSSPEAIGRKKVSVNVAALRKPL